MEHDNAKTHAADMSEISLSTALERYCPLPPQDKAALARLEGQPASFGRGTDIFIKADPDKYFGVITEGWAAQYHLMQDGRRSILKLCLPEDVVLGIWGRQEKDYSVHALTAGRLYLFRRDAIFNIMYERPAIMFALLKLEARQHDYFRERVVTLTRLTAFERTAYVCLELLTRLEAIGRADNNSFVLPASQTVLGDLLGLSAVHVNRVFQRLEEEGFISRERETIRINDREALARIIESRPEHARF